MIRELMAILGAIILIGGAAWAWLPAGVMVAGLLILADATMGTKK